MLLDGRRKSMQPMAERLGVDHQQLQQFITSSTWPSDDHRYEKLAVRNEATALVAAIDEWLRPVRK